MNPNEQNLNPQDVFREVNQPVEPPVSPMQPIQPVTPETQSAPAMPSPQLVTPPSVAPSLIPTNQGVPTQNIPPAPQSNWQTPNQNPGQNVFSGQIKNHMTLAVISFLFSWPFGIAAIIFASKVNSSLAAGDIAGAEKASKTAKILSMIAIIIGILAVVALIAIASIGAARRQAQENSNNPVIESSGSSSGQFDKCDSLDIKNEDEGFKKKFTSFVPIYPASECIIFSQEKDIIMNSYVVKNVERDKVVEFYDKKFSAWTRKKDWEANPIDNDILHATFKKEEGDKTLWIDIDVSGAQTGGETRATLTIVFSRA